MAPAELRGNLNRLVTTALREYTEIRKRQAFEKAMADMAADPAIRSASAELLTAFRTTETDGLPKDTVFLCFQLRALDPARFRDPRTGLAASVGQLPPARMAEVDAALRAVLSL